MTTENSAKAADVKQSKLVSGVAWSTAGNFISRLLGVAYVIPWYAWLGQYANQANSLFGMGYNIYSYFLLLSTVGIPLAVAKQIAKYNSLGKEEVSYYLVKQFLKVMVVVGIVFAGAMYLLSPLLGGLSGAEKELLPVMRSLSLAVLFFPAMSVLRGTYQGINNLKPYAISQIIEQVVRIIWLLSLTYIIMRLGSGNYLDAVVQSTFAAFVGMLASFVYLLYRLSCDGILSKIWRAEPSQLEVNSLEILLETTKEAIPFIVIGSAIQLFQIIDQWTFPHVMKLLGDYSKDTLLVLYSYMISNPSKITMILIAVAGSIGGVSFPIVTEYFVKKNHQMVARFVRSSFSMLMIFLMPAIIGALILGQPLYHFFFGQAMPLELYLLIVNLLQVFIVSIYTVLGVLLQGIFDNRKAVQYFVIGLVAKLVLQVPSIYLLGVYGPLMATTFGLGLSCLLMYRRLYEQTRFNRRALVKEIALILAMTVIMSIPVSMVELLLRWLLPATSRLSSIVHLVIGGGIGVVTYGVLALWTREADKLLGQARADGLRRKLHLKAR